jgi:hypothetical protein
VLVHLPNGFFSSSGGIEYTLLLTVACVALAMRGPGEAGLDRALAWRGIPLTGEKVRYSKARPQETASGGDSTRSLYRVGDREKKQGFPSS